MTNLYSVSMNLRDKKCLVIGGGKVAQRKITGLLQCNAIVVVVSPKITETIEQLAANGKITYYQRVYSSEDLTDAYLVISATDNSEVNSQVAKACQQKGILVNVADEPSLCSFFVNSVIRRGDLTISISTNGKSPLLASTLKKDLEDQFGDEYKAFLEIMGEVREEVLAKCDNPIRRKEIFNIIFFELNILQLLKDGDISLAKERVRKCLSSLLV